MATTWIPRTRKAGGQIFSSTRLVGLERSGGAWLATARENRRTLSIQAGHVFLCGGAVQTPLLLRRAGIRRNVGNSLAMHPTIKVVALFEDEVNYPELGVPFHQVREFAPRMSFGCSISSPPHLALAMLDHPEDSGRVLPRWSQAAVYYVAVTGPATGKVRRLPVTGDPFIRYQVRHDDLADLAGGMRLLCRLLLEAGAVELFPAIAGCGRIRTADDLEKIPRAVSESLTNLLSLHVFSSCPMGERRELAAVDSWGRVWDAPGLSVHDASVLCDAPGVNPQGSVMAFAHRNTLRYLADRAH
jgi:choline dehydrogenase-like flavoprotein